MAKLTIPLHYGTPSSKEVIEKSPCIDNFKAYINGPIEILEPAISKALGVRINGTTNYEKHSAVKDLCGWWNVTVKDPELKCANNFCLYYWNKSNGMFISCDYEEPPCTFENMQKNKYLASFDYKDTKVVAVFLKSDKYSEYIDNWATNYQIDGEIWMQIGCELSEINTSCISMSCLQYLSNRLCRNQPCP